MSIEEELAQLLARHDRPRAMQLLVDRVVAAVREGDDAGAQRAHALVRALEDKTYFASRFDAR